jgi:hypothetical protein
MLSVPAINPGSAGVLSLLAERTLQTFSLPAGFLHQDVQAPQVQLTRLPA